MAAINIESRVIQAVSEQLGIMQEQVTPEKGFVADLGCDSLDTLELVMTLEDEFGIEVADEDAEKLVTVQDAVDYLSLHPTAV